MEAECLASGPEARACGNEGEDLFPAGAPVDYGPTVAGVYGRGCPVGFHGLIDSDCVYVTQGVCCLVDGLGVSM